MELIDTHCHLYDEQFDADRDEVVARATEAGIETIIMPAIEISSYDSMMACAARYAGFALPCIGLHPTSVGPSWEEEMAFVEGHAREKGFVAIGEIGLDGYWSRDYMAEQKRVFAAQLDMAAQGGLPAIIHLRDATEELFEVLEEVRGLPLKGVFHAFSGSYETYRRILGYGDFKKDEDSERSGGYYITASSKWTHINFTPKVGLTFRF